MNHNSATVLPPLSLAALHRLPAHIVPVATPTRHQQPVPERGRRLHQRWSIVGNQRNHTEAVCGAFRLCQIETRTGDQRQQIPKNEISNVGVVTESSRSCEPTAKVRCISNNKFSNPR